MGVLSTSVGTIHKKVNEYYDCRTSGFVNSEVRDIALDTFMTSYAIEDMQSIKQLYHHLINKIRELGIVANLVPSNIDFIEVLDEYDRFGYIYILPYECTR